LPAVIGLDHVQLAMPPGGEERARGFYRDLLGIPEQPKPKRLTGRGGCWFEDGAVRLHLGVEPDFRPARKAHPALLVHGLDALAELLAQSGHPVAFEAESSVLRGYVDDPFGNRIELIEAIPRS
jgi:catechol 2,3-dioxygenase-like lactoylglutathione lyase family enzyme